MSSLAEPLDLEELDEDSSCSRRGLFALGAAALLTGLATTAEATGQRAPNPALYARWRSAPLRLARRISFGLNYGLNTEARRIGYNALLQQQLYPSQIDDTTCEREVARLWPRVNESVAKLRTYNDEWRTADQLTSATIYRAVNSKRQLHRRMVEFWTDHFNVWIGATGANLMVPFVRDVITANALGNFRTLLRGVCFSPAMLNYLNADRNFCHNPNVNFARELMELHTIGVDAGYTPQDIVSVALAFTGWRWHWTDRDPKWGTFRYDHDAHAVGAKVVLGQIIPSGAQDEGEKVIDLLFNHPRCSLFVCRKLCRFFLGEDVPQATVDSAAATFRSTRGDIRATLRVILSQANVMASKPRYKRPFHLIASGLRACRATMSGDTWQLRVGQLERAGHAPFQWETPDGYPDRFDFWAAAPLPRLNFALTLANNRLWGTTVDVVRWFGNERDPDRVRDRLDSFFFGGEMAQSDRDALEQYLRNGLLTDSRLRGAAALCMASPSFQWY